MSEYTEAEVAKSRRFDVKNAADYALSLVQLAGGNEATLNGLIVQFATTLDAVAEVVIGAQTKNAVQAAFPGTTTVIDAGPFGQQAAAPAAQPVPNFQPSPAPMPQTVVQTPQYQAAGGPAPVQAPTPVPGATSGDGDPEVAANWNLFFSDQAAWNDKRGNKKGPNSPDFQHKHLKQPGKDYPLALWVNDKKNPSWVFPTLQQRGLA